MNSSGKFEQKEFTRKLNFNAKNESIEINFFVNIVEQKSLDYFGSQSIDYWGYQIEYKDKQVKTEMNDAETHTTVTLNFIMNEHYIISEYQSNIFTNVTSLGSMLSIAFGVYKIITFLMLN